MGAGWLYVSKRADCEDSIRYCPASTLTGMMEGYYSYRCAGAMDISPKYGSHKEAITACMWK